MKIDRPTLLVNESTARANIRRMAQKAATSGLIFRPHMKTHQSEDVANWFRDEGVSKITVSSVDMANYFAKAGFDDITIAFPYNWLEADKIAELAARIQLNLVIESAESLQHLATHVRNPINYFVKLDIGYHRTGVNPDDTKTIHALAKSKNSSHQLIGILGHAGHSYRAIDQKSAQKVYKEAQKAFQKAVAELGRADLILSYGDTPTCSVLEKFSGIHELRPGNFVFYDLMQYGFGSCEFKDIAVCMACPVVAIHPDREEIILYGGSVHFSKDFLTVNGKRNYGLVVNLNDSGWKSAGSSFVSKLSQEHGTIKATKELLEIVSVGDIVGVIPVHSCLAVDANRHVRTLDGKEINMMSKK